MSLGLVPVLLISFQNCGQKLTSNLNSQAAPSEAEQSSNVSSAAGRCSVQLNKCVVGQFVDVVDSATENKWLCQGSGTGGVVSCAQRIVTTTPLPPVQVVNGQCSQQLNQCYTGTFSDLTDTTTENKWSCVGVNGGTTASCASSKPPVIQDPVPSVVNGQCSANLNQCSAGQFRDDTDTASQYRWTCLGLNGGSGAACSMTIAPAQTPVNGACGSGVNQCTTGNFLDLVDSDFQYQWSCLGASGGSAVTCSVVKPPTSPAPLPSVSAPTNVTYLSALDLKYPGANGDVTFDFYHPSDLLTKQNLPVFIWIHGGGWTGGDKSLDRDLAQKIAERGFIVLNVNYTLAPPTPASQYPQPYIAPVPYNIGVRDILAAVELVKQKAADFHIDLQKISIGGGSAGGHLALMTAAAGATTFNCLISAAGPTDLSKVTQMSQFPVTVWIAKSVFGDNDNVLKANSPVYQANNIQARRVYLLHQEKDNLVPIDQARSFVTAARGRFQSALETTFYNDPLPAGTPYEYPSPAQITHNFDTTLLMNTISQYLGSKCY